MEEILNKIGLMKKTAEELKSLSNEFPALCQNMVRMSASIKMLELNVSDLEAFDLLE
jgi:hypothetical protein